jgi:preprotein translocase subunit YajC
MTTILTIVLLWITLMTLILWKMPPKQMKAIQDFLKNVLPKIPITSIIEAFRKK